MTRLPLLPLLLRMLPLMAALLLAACGEKHWPAALAPLAQQAYIWQQAWTPALRDAIKVQRPGLSGWRVLLAERRDSGAWASAQIDWALLAASGLPVTAVLRIDAQWLRLSGDRDGDPVAVVLAQWRAAQAAAKAAGMPAAQLAGLEIDHDCASARLPGYNAFLRALKPQIDGHLSITALPAWLSQPKALKALLATVDGHVLQVHGVSRPQQGLWDAAQTGRWLDDWARLAPGPFALALPSYGSAVRLSGRGELMAVLSSTPELARRWPVDSVQRELMADPLALARFLKQINAARPINLQAVYWFRLPVAGERRSFSPASWQTLRQDPAGFVAQTAAAALSLDAEPQGSDRWLWRLHNASAVDVMWPTLPALPPPCTQPVPVAAANPALLRSGDRVAVMAAFCPGLTLESVAVKGAQQE